MNKGIDIIKWKSFSVFGVKLLLTDLVILGSLIVYSMLNVIFMGRFDNWFVPVLKNVGVAAIYIILILLYQKSKKRVVRFFLRTAAVQFMFSYLFAAVHQFQLLFFNWNDDRIISLEKSIFGEMPTVFLQQFTPPLLTEILMFAYVIYIPLYPIIAAIIYFKYGEEHFEYYLLVLGVTNVVCNIGFILFPVASPVWWESTRALHPVPMKGYFFTRIGEYIRANLHQAGGSIPSPHCSISTIMWYFSFRYSRKFSFYLIPVVVLIYLSTVFCAYHYLTDSITGIFLAIIMIVFSRYYLNKVKGRNPIKG
jgi:membrane-associated phospholipid phosphatase